MGGAAEFLATIRAREAAVAERLFAGQPVYGDAAGLQKP
jgi:hypothetical protein